MGYYLLIRKEIDMKDGNLEYVYLARSSHGDSVKAWDPNIGIIKCRGCVYFISAKSLGKGGEIGPRWRIGLIDCERLLRHEDYKAMEAQFGFIPAPGTAWLVNTVTLERKRIDQDMALIDPDTGKVVG